MIDKTWVRTRSCAYAMIMTMRYHLSIGKIPSWPMMTSFSAIASPFAKRYFIENLSLSTPTMQEMWWFKWPLWPYCQLFEFYASTGSNRWYHVLSFHHELGEWNVGLASQFPLYENWGTQPAQVSIYIVSLNKQKHKKSIASLLSLEQKLGKTLRDHETI